MVELYIIVSNSHSLREPSKGVKAKHSLRQLSCGRHGWIDTEYVLYKDGIVALIDSQSQQSTTQFYILDAAFSDYGNSVAFKHTYTSLHGMWKTDDWWHVLNQHFLY